MLSKLGLTGLSLAALTVALTAQGGGGGNTRLDEFGGKLKLDAKTQAPAVRQIFDAAAKEAGPIATEMVQLRNTWLNLEINNRTADIPVAMEAYTVSATKMTAMETAVFQKVYATLQPNQQSRAPEAFAFMAGFFQAAGGRGGGGRGGRGGQQ